MTFVDRLRSHAETRGTETLYTFLSDGEVDGPRDELTFAGLDARARAIGAMLQADGGRGERALLLYPPGLEFITAFMGCLYGGVVAVPAYPPDPSRLDRTLPRLRAVVRDCDARFVLTTGAVASMATALFDDAPDLAAPRWVATDELDPALAERWEHPRVAPESTAFLQYTSGSTSTPKGVMVSHANIVHNASVLGVSYGRGGRGVGTSWLPMYHDMGLIGGLLTPLYAHFPVVLLSPLDFLQKPLRWLRAVTRYRATTMVGPNFAYELCARKAAGEDLSGLDLSSVEIAGNGAEPVRADTLERFCRAFAPCGFRREAMYPCYGLAESTLIVSGGRVEEAPAVAHVSAESVERGRVELVDADAPGSSTRAIVSCGPAVDGMTVRVVDPARCVPCAPDEIGEIWVTGPSVARGYWNRAEETEQAFGARLADSGDGPFLRTGDLGFLRGGELYVTGRLKDLLILRGRNYYPTDVEQTVERAHPAVRPGCVAAFAVTVDGEEQLAVAAEVSSRREPVDPAAITAALREAVFAEHELRVKQVVLLPAGTIPKTSSGKLQRRETRARLLAGTLETLSSDLDRVPAPAPAVPTGPLVAQLVAQTARVLGVPPHGVDPDAPLRALALESIMVAELLAGISASTGRELDFAEFRQAKSLRDLADRMASAPPAKTASLPADPGNDRAVSFAQEALIEECESIPGAWVHTRGFRFEGSVDEAALAHALRRLAHEREIFRTAFGPGPLSRTLDLDAVTLSVEDAATLDEPALASVFAAEALRPFRLADEPPLRARLLRRGAGHALLLVSVHHVAYDAVTLPRIFHRLFSLYLQYTAGLPPLDMPVVTPWRTLARTERAWVDSDEGRRERAWWLDALRGAQLYPGLAGDVARRGPGGHVLEPLPPVVLGADEMNALRALGRHRGVTMASLVTGAYASALGAAVGANDVVLGLTASLRDDPRLRELDGPVLNFLFVRVTVSPDPLATVEAARDAVEAAFAHRRYPSVDLARRLAPTPEGGFLPRWCARAVLNYYGLRRGDDAAARLSRPLRLGDVTVSEIPLAGLPVAKSFDLGMYATEREGGLSLELRHAAAFLDRAGAQRLLDRTHAFLTDLAARAP